MNRLLAEHRATCVFGAPVHPGWRFRVDRERLAALERAEARYRGYISSLLQATPRLIRFLCQLQEKLLELLRLADEESVGNEAIDSSRGIKLTRTGWTDDGAFRQAFDEVRWLRHDQVCLERLRLAHSQIDKRQLSAGLIVG